jgi:uncharacterized protein (TIGR00255 family)
MLKGISERRSLLSMTGFGRASVELGERRLRIEIRSVNHRGLDLKIRSQTTDGYCEAEIARAVRGAAERGALTVSIREEAAPATGAIDEGRARAVHAALERLQARLGLHGPVALSTVAAFIGASPATPEQSGEALWEALRPGVDAALAQLRATRAREGEALAADLLARVARLQGIAGAIQVGAAGLPERFARRLEERLAALRGQPGFEPGRLAQEAALMAERLDVSEEITRLGTHLDHLREIIGAPATAGAVGRKLDFVIQEVGREINTIGSKAQDAPIAALVIDGKVELEKIREQAQNIE